MQMTLFISIKIDIALPISERVLAYRMNALHKLDFRSESENTVVIQPTKDEP
jgi:hypothetical protein